jgi:hypothetical protein
MVYNYVQSNSYALHMPIVTYVKNCWFAVTLLTVLNMIFNCTKVVWRIEPCTLCPSSPHYCVSLRHWALRCTLYFTWTQSASCCYCGSLVGRLIKHVDLGTHSLVASAHTCSDHFSESHWPWEPTAICQSELVEALEDGFICSQDESLDYSTKSWQPLHPLFMHALECTARPSGTRVEDKKREEVGLCPAVHSRTLNSRPPTV